MREREGWQSRGSEERGNSLSDGGEGAGSEQGGNRRRERK